MRVYGGVEPDSLSSVDFFLFPYHRSVSGMNWGPSWKPLAFDSTSLCGSEALLNSCSLYD